MFSGAALAQQTIDEVLTQNEKMSQVSDGLYLQKDGQGESYVAVNHAGRVALAETMARTRVAIATQFAVDGISRTEQTALDELDRSIAELSNAVGIKAQQERTGFCGTTQVYARAISNGGTSASGYSVASNPSGGAVAATANYAQATNGFAFNSTNTVGANAASVSATNPTACVSTALARVSCPGDSAPKVIAYAFSARTSGPGCGF
ncbi:MAG: hypothetical protein JNN30_10315 [Rhodanobacteraceae bacterium]|nr:hypothetical protein [Rhodanobacteraceae bacterium]